MKEERNIFDVISRLIEALPEEHRDTFVKLRSDCLYKAPEMMWEQWRRIGYELRMIAQWPPVEQWEWDCAVIITGKTVNEIQQESKNQLREANA